jgi:hypothetical protein
MCIDQYFKRVKQLNNLPSDSWEDDFDFSREAYIYRPTHNVKKSIDKVENKLMNGEVYIASIY